MNKEPTLRNEFHKLGNLIFQTILAAGTIRENLTEPNRQTEITAATKDIEKTGMQADEVLGKIKKYVYGKLDPDVSIEE